MLLHFVAVPLVMMACASEALEATFDCIVTKREIDDCLKKPEQKMSFTQIKGKMALYNMPKITTILKNLTTNGCIASEWTNVQAWISLNTPPKTFIAIYKNFTKAQKTTLWKIAVWDYSKPLRKQMITNLEAVNKVLNEKLRNLSEADKEEYDEWVQKFSEACLQ
uniref:Uncharacterized protein n=1 Tax=Plectus sambesii TaxID=2011161 RepID=A0A914X6G9_9BILA